jgi:hypothetical protein
VTFTEHHADPDAVRVRSLAIGEIIIARSVAEVDLATERLAAAIRGAQDARKRVVADMARAEMLMRLAALLADGALEAETLEAAGTAIEAIEEALGLGHAPGLVAS